MNRETNIPNFFMVSLIFKERFANVYPGGDIFTNSFLGSVFGSRSAKRKGLAAGRVIGEKKSKGRPAIGAESLGTAAKTRPSAYPRRRWPGATAVRLLLDETECQGA